MRSPTRPIPVAGATGVDVSGIELEDVHRLVDEHGTLVPPPMLCEVLDALSAQPLNDHDLIEVIAAWSRVEQAITWRRVGAGADFHERPYRGGGGRREFASDEIAVRLGRNARVVQRELNVADLMRNRLPSTVQAWATGRIDVRKASVIAEASALIPASGAARLEAELLHVASERTPAGLQRRATRLVHVLDPKGADARCQRAKSERRVCGTPLPDGMAELTATLSGYDWVVINSALNAAARGLKSSGDPRSMDQLRADALVAPFLKALHTGTLDGLEPLTLARHRKRSVRIDVTISAASLWGLSDDPADLSGYGPIAADEARRIARDAMWRRLVTDPLSGAVIDAGPDRYEPSSALAELIEARDQTCRWSGCGVRAVNADLDHTVRFPVGSTTRANLGALCRRHHRMKHEVPGVRLMQDGNGRFVWTLPTGHRVAVDPPATGPPGSPTTK